MLTLTHSPPRFRAFRFALLVTLAAILIGCQKKAPPAVSSAPPVIPVALPVERDVTDFAEYTGRTDAVQSVSIRPLVTGELKAMPFAEGTEVRGPGKNPDGTDRPGDLLFKIDPEQYIATAEQAEGQLNMSKAQKKVADENLEQSKQGYTAGVVSDFQLNQDKARVEQVVGQIKSAEAALKLARVNVTRTEIRAPISGRISRYYYTVGNLATANQTLLTTIVSMEKMYAYFDVDEQAVQRIKQDIARALAKKDLAAALESITVRMAIVGETGYPHVGKLNFINNQVNPSTGTYALRAVFDNERVVADPKQKTGKADTVWKLDAGMFVRVRLDIGTPHKTLLVIDKAIGADQGQKFVYVVDAENKVQTRRVETGSLQEGGLRVIAPYKPKTDKEPESGIKPDEWIVVGGLPQLRPRIEIQPEKLAAMPTTLPGGDPTQRAPGGKKK
jgi:multidrug efflux system membrane fusion protein